MVFMVGGWFFVVQGRFSWFFMGTGWFLMVPGWFFMVPGQFYWLFMVLGTYVFIVFHGSKGTFALQEGHYTQGTMVCTSLFHCHS